MVYCHTSCQRDVSESLARRGSSGVIGGHLAWTFNFAKARGDADGKDRNQQGQEDLTPEEKEKAHKIGRVEFKSAGGKSGKTITGARRENLVIDEEIIAEANALASDFCGFMGYGIRKGDRFGLRIRRSGFAGRWHTSHSSGCDRLILLAWPRNDSFRNYNFDSRGTVATNSVPGLRRRTWIAAFNCFESARTIRVPSPGAECGSKSAGSP
jgi:hypothetical protein